MNFYKLKKIWKIILLIAAINIGFFSLWYTNRLVKTLAIEEEKKVHTWANATQLLASDTYDGDLSFISNLIQSNSTIPIIMTDDKGKIIDHLNIDKKISSKPHLLEKELEEMKEERAPIVNEFARGRKNFIYYKNSVLLTKLKYYPYFQLGIISLFLFISYVAFSTSRRSEENQVWVGWAKETAHQLATPISSLMAWLDYIKISGGNVDEDTMEEMQKDINRLLIITERFSKMGAKPVLHKVNLTEVLKKSVDYIRVRSSKKVIFEIFTKSPDDYFAMINIPLFDWVIENISKNAIDAMNGEGKITFYLMMQKNSIIIDITDTGKGILPSQFKTIFKPGFTTKKRGWGLGLTLVKRIIENYHRGNIFVKESIPNQGTTFRIILKST